MTWRRRRAVTVLFFAAVLLAVASLSLTIGQIAVPIPDVLAITARRLGFPLASAENVSAMQEAVVWQIRMPRTLVGLLVGAALGISGAVMQGIFANPLADPGIIGVSAGASAGAVLCIALGLSTVNLFFMPTFAFAGSLFAVALTIFLALRRGKVPVMPLLLAGVAVGMFLGAVTSGLLTFMNEQKVQEYLFWIVGGLDYRRWDTCIWRQALFWREPPSWSCWRGNSISWPWASRKRGPWACGSCPCGWDSCCWRP